MPTCTSHRMILTAFFSQLPWTLVLCLFAGCQPSSRQQAGAPLRLEIVYHVHHTLDGLNVTAADGVEEYIFQNTDDQKPLTLRFPPAEIYFIGSNFRMKLARSSWPDFAKNSTSTVLPPGGRCTFNAPFNMDVAKSSWLGRNDAPTRCFVFDSSGQDKRQDKVYTGSVVGESHWDTSEVIR